jgi:hypothetical protein
VFAVVTEHEVALIIIEQVFGAAAAPAAAAIRLCVLLVTWRSSWATG